MMQRWRSSMTVGEANAEDGVSRSCLWAQAVFLQLLIFALALGLDIVIYILTHGAAPARDLSLLVAWAPYLALALAITSYIIDLSLPLAPVAARYAVLYGAALAGGTLLGAGALVVCLNRHAPATIALVGVLAVALAGLLALWIWLDRTYRDAYYLPS